jgi:CheY-like chemotaxis protein
MERSASRSTSVARVLVIDGDPDTVDLLRVVENFERPDIILLDLMMPGIPDTTYFAKCGRRDPVPAE